MSATPRECKRARLAGLIANDFRALATARPDATLSVAYTWEGVERLAKRLELMPDHLARMLVSECSACGVEPRDPTAPSRPSRLRGRGLA